MQEDNINEIQNKEADSTGLFKVAKDKIVKGLEEVLDAKQRMKKKLAMKKAAPKIKLGKKKALNKVASKDKLKTMAMNTARKMVAKKLTKGQDKGDMSFAARASLEKKLKKKAGAIKKLAKKLMPKVKKANKEKVKAHKASK